MNSQAGKPNSLHLIGAGLGPWAMEPAAVTALLERGEQAFAQLNPAALEAYRSEKHMKGQRVGVRGDVGILNVAGPLLKYESWLTGVFGLSTYETLRRDFQVMIDDPEMKAILLKVDSPGGEVSGCDEFARAVFDARGKKPITAFVSGMACSAGYWIASAADRIVVSDSAIVGSIGVVMTMTDYSKSDEARGIKRTEFVSSQSPNKRPDATSGEGAARIQKIVDDLGDVFVSAVAKHRGVPATTVTQKYGLGGVEIGAKAVKSGAADEVGQFEATLTNLQRRVKALDKSASQAMESIAIAPLIAPRPSADVLAKAAAFAKSQMQANGSKPAPGTKSAEDARKADIAAMWKRATDHLDAGPHAVKSAL